MAWAYFQNQAAWDTYHNAACTVHAIPRPGYRADNNTTVMLTSQWTDAWCDPVQIRGQGNVTSWVARVPDADVTTFTLTAIPDAAVVFPDTITNPNGSITVTVANKVYTVVPTTITWRKAKPATWTDPHDGHVYQVT